MADLVQVGGATYRRSGGGWLFTGAARECAVGPKMCAMLDRIAELESPAPVVPVVPVVTEVTEAIENAFMQAYKQCETENDLQFTHRMGINAGIAAALTAASEVRG